jgi:hypothetical protein
MIFNTRVTKASLFSNGKPLLLWHNSTYLTDRWKTSTESILKLSMTGDFMTQIPFVVPRQVLPEMREWILKQHNAASLLDVWKSTVMDPSVKHTHPKAGANLCQFCIIGAYLWHKHPEWVTFVNPQTTTTPTRRVARHLGWEPFSYDGTERRSTKLSPLYVETASKGIHEGLCFSAVRHCDPAVVPQHCSKYRKTKVQQSLFLWQGEPSGPMAIEDPNTELMWSAGDSPSRPSVMTKETTDKIGAEL